MDGKEETEELTWNRETVPKVLKIVSTRLSQKDLICLLLVSPWLYRTLVSYPSPWLIISLRETKNVGNRLMAALSLPRYRHVKEINLEFAKNIDDSHLEIIQNKCADSLQNLESLNLNACQSISDNGIKYITKVCPKLKVFNIYWNVRLTDTGIEYLVKRCKHIIHLNLSGCKNISDKSLKLVSDNYPKLEFLNLTRCLKLTDSGLQLILRGCSSLQNLNLYALSSLSDGTYNNLSLLSHLKDLDLCGAQNLSDEGLSSIAKCKGLVSLNLTWLVTGGAEDFFTSYEEVFDSFDAMRLQENLLRGIYAYGFEKPSAIQQMGIVPFCQGLDVIQQAQSRTGKTATSCSVILQQLDYSLVQFQALVLAPTRELAQQIEKVMWALGDYLGMKVRAYVSGTSVCEDQCILQASVHVVGTPGRVFDMLRRQSLCPDYIKMFVLDEADEMLSRGFEDQVCSMLETVNHLFLHYYSARFLWLKALGEVGLHWVAPVSVRGMFLDSSLGFGSNKMAKILWNCMVFFPSFGIFGWRETTESLMIKKCCWKRFLRKLNFRLYSGHFRINPSRVFLFPW